MMGLSNTLGVLDTGIDVSITAGDTGFLGTKTHSVSGDGCKIVAMA